MRRQVLDAQAIRRAAADLADAEGHTSTRLRRSRANVLRHELLEIRQRASLVSSGLRVIRNAYTLELLRERRLMRAERRLLSLVAEARGTPAELFEVIAMVRHEQDRAMLGRANQPQLRVLLSRPGLDPHMRERIARYFRRGPYSLNGQRLSIRLKQRVAAVAMLAGCQFAFAIHLIDAIYPADQDAGTFVGCTLIASICFAYLLHPIVQGFRNEIRDREAFDACPYLSHANHVNM